MVKLVYPRYAVIRLGVFRAVSTSVSASTPEEPDVRLSDLAAFRLLTTALAGRVGGGVGGGVGVGGGGGVVVWDSGSHSDSLGVCKTEVADCESCATGFTESRTVPVYSAG